MAKIDSSFFQYSRKITEKFLQSTVVIDDCAIFPGAGAEPVAAKMTTPPRRVSVGRAVKELAGKTAKIERETISEDPHQLNAKKVIDGFAAKGIVCSVIKPDQEDRTALPDYMYKLSFNADMIVIDWSMQEDDGEIALSLMKQLITGDLLERAQLRLIAIYTIDQDIEKIPNKIKDSLEVQGIRNILLSEEAPFTIQIGSIRIIVLSKPGADIPKDALKQQVAFEQLADRLTTEFTAMTIGLVSNVVLNSLAEIRINNHKIVTNFASDLDAPYLTQRSLLENPEDAEEHLVALVAAELSAILEEKDVRVSANIKAIKQWIDYKKSSDDEFIFDVDNGPSIKWNKEQVIDLLEKGLNIVNNDKYKIGRGSFIKNALNSNLTKMYYGEGVSQPYLDEKFAVIANFRSFYGKPIPRLNLGTIIKTIDATNKYYICIQPRCDCVRIQNRTNFLFLPLTLSEGNDVELVVKDNGTFMRFCIKKSSYDIKPIEFMPKLRGKGCIVAHMRKEGYCFKDTRRNIYKWIGELRIEHALSLSNEFSSELVRVGPNESEWLRRKKSKRG